MPIQKESNTIANPFECGFYGFIGVFCAQIVICCVIAACWLVVFLLIGLLGLITAAAVSDPHPKSVPKPRPQVSQPAKAKASPPAVKTRVRDLETLNAEMKALNQSIQDASGATDMSLIREKIKLQKELDKLHGK